MRGHPGERHHFAKLTDSDVKCIRLIYDTGLYTYKDIARQFDVCIMTICRVVKKKYWRHVREH